MLWYRWGGHKVPPPGLDRVKHVVPISTYKMVNLQLLWKLLLNSHFYYCYYYYYYYLYYQVPAARQFFFIYIIIIVIRDKIFTLGNIHLQIHSQFTSESWQKRFRPTYCGLLPFLRHKTKTHNLYLKVTKLHQYRTPEIFPNSTYSQKVHNTWND